MEYKENSKLIIEHLTKEYYLIVVSQEVFKNSNDIESVGYCDGIKVKSQEHLNFLLDELNKNGYILEIPKDI
jgi:ATP adenylyltransferase/5',5'''-P-1,P-4-tetraphosphate phosphorylase II